ncbi:MAG: hypothetical protein LBH58_08905 [Tannerellaceae bacterium]|nr:hypothetical protein [Tannerellaceae bacterium]
MNKSILLLLFTLSVYSCINGSKPLHIEERNGVKNNLLYTIIDTVRPREAKDIRSSNWAIGAEMMDRDFTVYKYWKDYLGKLGVKKARIQSGWAKTEKEKGIYSWEWLDEIVYDMVDQQVEPWIDLCYGNPLYADGGGTLLNAYIPRSEEGINAWKNFVKAIVQRYADHVTDWEIWNEPNYRVSVEDYAHFLILTSAVIREVSPKANIIGFAVGSGVDYKYVDRVLRILDEKGKIDVINEISHHRHIPVPEKREPETELEKVVKRYGNRIKIRQGEAGCPSEFSTQFALNNYYWTEFSQAKHVLRRLLTDLGHDKPSCCFTIMDAKDIPKGWNRKGLLKSAEDQTVAYPKPAYFAVQHLTSLFDHTVTRNKDFTYSAELPDSCRLSAYGYSRMEDRTSIITLWQQGNIPTNENTNIACNLTLPQAKFKKPVYINMISGCVYEIPSKDWSEKNGEYRFDNIPIYDYPIVIADISLVKRTL